MKIEWHQFAKRDFVEIIQYIARENVQAAYRIQEEIALQIDVLKNYPYAGRPGRVQNTRELVIVRTPYIAAYKVLVDKIIILRVLHGARKWSLERKVELSSYQG